MSLLIIPGALVVLGLLLWVLYRMEAGIPQEPDTHQHHLNDHTLHEGERP